MKKRLKNISAGLLVLLIAGCTANEPNFSASNKDNLILAAEFSQLQKEYLPFKTKELTESYLKRKLETWLGPPANGDKLVKELRFAMEKYPALLKELLSGDTGLYAQIYDNESVRQFSALSDAFRGFIDTAGTVSIVSTIAGDGTLGYEEGTAARFNFPLGVAMTSPDSSYLYVADTFSQKIKRIDLSNNNYTSTVAGNGSVGDADGTDASFNYPHGLGADNSGHLFVPDTFNNRIRMIDLNNNNEVSTIAGNLNGESGFRDGTDALFFSPTSIVADNNGRIYVTDAGNHSIRMVDLNNGNTVSTIAGNGTDGDADGTDARFYFPMGVTMDNLNNGSYLYVSDTFNNKIRRIDLNNGNNVTTIAGNDTAGYADGTNSRFSSPFGIDLDNIGHLYVADGYNQRIRMIDLNNNNTVSTIAGNGKLGYDNGADASFNYPYGVAADNSGHIYVAESDNHTIRKITQ
jgi:sugar lactone lactonase YvrE